MSDTRFYQRVDDLLASGNRFAILHLIRHQGATPNDPGSKMIVFPDGSIEFTIGGGPFEASAIRDAVAALASNTATVREYDLRYETIGMRCGGKATVYIEILRPRLPLWIFGAGHVGRSLVTLTRSVPFFSITLIDDRPSMLDLIEPGPDVRLVLTDRTFEDKLPPLPEDVFIVIVTRCHDIDEQILRRILPLDQPAYLGMIGSKAKVATLKKHLVDEGFDPNRLDRLDAPIGVPTGGKLPEEIAVSILARLLQAKNGIFPSYRP